MHLLTKSVTTILLSFAYSTFAFAHAHGDEETEASHGTNGHHGISGQNDHAAEGTEYPPNYFAHPDHVALLYAHIALMVLAWVFFMPVAVMLSLAKSRYTLLSQVAFTAINGVGIFLATIYNAQTPDLYPNNAHHSVGWVATWIAFAQFAISLLTWLARRARNASVFSGAHDQNTLLPTSRTSPDGEQAQDHTYFSDYRLSDDDGQGSASTGSHRNSSASTVIDDEEGLAMPSPHKEYDGDFDQHLDDQHLGSSRAQGIWSKGAISVVSSKLWFYVALVYNTTDRVILPLGFIAFTTGIVTLGRFFEGQAIFNGLAHWIKGGVFFWLGLFTLGRWSGSFGDLGWAWNIQPQSSARKWRPSAEFVESALIFFYGSTNVFLEHLGGWGGAWSAQDLEHLAITILFFGGGLCGMLIESTRIRNFLNVATVEAVADHVRSNEEEQGLSQEEPATYQFSLNPIPALVILLLGTMMSSHHQDTMISTMIHKQWGNLLVGASFARGLTYVLLYLKPPVSILPSRPPTELLTAFGLIAGGIVFMASSSDTIQGMIHYDLDAMFMYTVTMGMVGLLMAWELIVLAIKGLATRSERRMQKLRCT